MPGINILFVAPLFLIASITASHISTQAGPSRSLSALNPLQSRGSFHISKYTLFYELKVSVKYSHKFTISSFDSLVIALPSSPTHPQPLSSSCGHKINLKFG